jgi:predicted acyltransferase
MAGRDYSLDLFRGITILLMVIVNVQGSPDNVYPLIEHAEWNGLTFADLVFPWFLFIAGLSAPLALDRKHTTSPWPVILKRAVILFGIGMLLSWLIHPTLDPDKVRWTGVLQRIAFVYVACAAVILGRPGYMLAAILCGAILILHSLLLLYVPAPGEAVPSLVAGQGLSGWLDRLLVPGRILRKTWDPEGVLSTLPSIASGLLGVAIMRWLVAQEKPVETKLLALAALLAIAGLALDAVLPVNKSLWTASFVLLTAGLGLGLWMGLRLLWPIIAANRIILWVVNLGQAALTLYVVHTVLLAVIVRKLPDGEKLWKHLFDGLAGITGLSLPAASLLFAVIATGISAAFIPPLKKRGYLIKA